MLAALGGRSAAYVYNADCIRAAARDLLELKSIGRVLYALKANPHPEVLRIVGEAGLDFECVSEGEMRRVLEALPGIARERIHYTPNFAPQEEYAWAFSQGVRVTVDNGWVLEAWPEVFRGRDIFVRIDTDLDHGHHDHVRTAGEDAKFGVPACDIDALATRAREIDARIVGLHAHNGSGVFDLNNWTNTAELLSRMSSRLPDVRVVDIGGGFGVPERADQPGVDFARLDAALLGIRAAHENLEIWIEPGRYLVAAAGVLLARVTQLKSKGETRYVGVATGMNSLLRPALYGAHHEIVNLTRLNESADRLVDVVGPICESADVLGAGRLLPSTTQASDVLLIANAGAYGHAMSSRYNLREPADEVFL